MKDHVAIIIRKNNKILFIRRAECKKILPNIWAFPSGTKEDKESIYGTVKREAIEELGVQVKVENILTTKELPEFKTRLHFIVCKIMSGKPVIKDFNEIEEIKWLTFEGFFKKYSDSQIGHGLIFLRKNPQIWKSYFN